LIFFLFKVRSKTEEPA